MTVLFSVSMSLDSHLVLVLAIGKWDGFVWPFSQEFLHGVFCFAFGLCLFLFPLITLCFSVPLFGGAVGYLGKLIFTLNHV